jgi:hypothetical protein
MSFTPTAHKGIVMIKRREGTTREAFRDWFLGPHARFGTNVDEIYRYTGSLVVAPGPRYAFPDGEPPFDLISEIWCRDRAGIEQAFAKLSAMGGPQNTIDHVSDRAAYIAEEYTLK